MSSGEHPSGGVSLLTPLPKDAGRSFGRLLQKKEIIQMKNLLLFASNPRRKFASQWWYHNTGPLRKKSKLCKKECFISDIPRNNPPSTPFLLLATKRESLSANQQLSLGVKNPWHERRRWSQIHLHDRSTLLLRHAIRKEDLRASRWELNWSDRRSDEQIRSKWNKPGQSGGPIHPS